jgi:hypothetical protein
MNDGFNADAVDDAVFNDGSDEKPPRGATPSRNPRVTKAAAINTFAAGIDRVCIEETKIVSGRTIPRAI